MKDDPDDIESFAHLIGSVKRLNQNKINPYIQQAKKSPVPNNSQSVRHSDQTRSFEQEQHLAISHELSESWFDSGLQKKVQKKIRQGGLPIDDHLDLHGYRRENATKALNSFIQNASFYHQKMLLVVHGKGLQSKDGAVIKPMVLNWLRQSPLVLAYCPAQIHHGGNGASYVYLRTHQLRN